MKILARTGLLGLSLAVAFIGMCWLAGANWDAGLLRYPGAMQIHAVRYDLYDLEHGWLTRSTAYQTAASPKNVAAWYADLLSGSETHSISDCFMLHQSRTLLRVVRAVTVQVCRLPPGTLILVNENIYPGP